MVNEKLECYIMLETGINNESDYDINSESDLKRIKDIFFNSSTDVYNTLKKFGFTVSDKKVFIGGNWYSYVPLFTLGSKPYKNVLDSEIIVKLDDKYCEKGYAKYQNGKCVNEMLVKGYVWKEVYSWEGDLNRTDYMWCIEETNGDRCVAGCDPHAYDD
ncbi:MAG: hypothetical protein MRZ42_03920 [Tenericutes bacterium]|nr:hypothetical protein [Mycoplasmatota bacterium]